MPRTREDIEGEIRGHKIYLRDTDYVAAKLAEGAATPEEYSEVLTTRGAARTKINELEAELANLLEETTE